MIAARWKAEHKAPTGAAAHGKSAARAAELDSHIGPTRAQAVGLFKVGRWDLDRATYLERHAPELAQKVAQGKLPLSRAHQEAQRQANLQQAAQDPTIQTGGDIITGDMAALSSLLADGSADLFFTDPLYAKESLGLYARVAELAQKVHQGSMKLAEAHQEAQPTNKGGQMKLLGGWGDHCILALCLLLGGAGGMVAGFGLSLLL